MFNKLKQYKDLRSQAKKIQGALADERAEGSGAWGKAKVVIDGNQQVLSVALDPALLNPAEKEKTEAAVRDAVNDAIKKIQKIMATKIQGMGGIDMPKF